MGPISSNDANTKIHVRIKPCPYHADNTINPKPGIVGPNRRKKVSPSEARSVIKCRCHSPTDPMQIWFNGNPLWGSMITLQQMLHQSMVCINNYSTMAHLKPWQYITDITVYHSAVIKSVIWDIRPKRILNSDLAKSRLPIINSTAAQSFCNFAKSTAMILPCSVQYFKTVGQRKRMLWTNEFLFWNFANSTAMILLCSVQYFKTVGQRKRMLWTNDISLEICV